MTEFKQYTPEQEARIEELRKKEELERKQREAKKHDEQLREQISGLNVGTPVRLDYRSTSFVGYIVKIHKGESRWKDTFDIISPHGLLEYIPKYSDGNDFKITKRTVQDMSGVVIPDELKDIHTKTLLKMLNHARMYWWYNEEQIGPPLKIGYDEIKAELANREHIPTRREKKVMRQYKKKTK